MVPVLDGNVMFRRLAFAFAFAVCAGLSACGGAATPETPVAPESPVDAEPAPMPMETSGPDDGAVPPPSSPDAPTPAP